MDVPSWSLVLCTGAHIVYLYCNLASYYLYDSSMVSLVPVMAIP